MNCLEPPETHYLSAALGWLGLGNAAEAELELSRISPGYQLHPDVLEVKWLVCAEQKKWTEGLQLARSLIHAAPDRASGWLHQAYALRRAQGGGLQQAWDALLQASEKFPRESLFAYNLSCYACQLGKADLAWTWLRRAISVGGKQEVQALALQDLDLQPLWDKIRRL